MKQSLVSFVAGVVFSLGLGLSQMTDPSRVIGFLDFTGNWDPTLAFVMGGAVAVYFAVHQVVRKRSAPLFASRFFIPQASDLDHRVLLGSAIFGIGWGLSGFCPGPAVTVIVSGAPEVLTFVSAMVVGILVYRVVAPGHEERRA